MESAIRVDANIKLQIAVFSTTAVSLNVSYRERINGVTKQPREANIASSRITTDAAANYFYYQFYGDTDDVSELLNVAVGLATSGVQRGQCFVRVGLTIGGMDGSAKDPFQVLFSDYVTSNSFLAYPGTSIKDSNAGRGNLLTLNPADPSAGAISELSLSNNFIIELFGVSLKLSTSGVVGNRKPFISFIDNNENSVRNIGIATTATAASTVKQYTFGILNNIRSVVDADGNGPTSSLNVVLEELSQKIILYDNGYFIRLGIENIDGADQISEVKYFVERWIKA